MTITAVVAWLNHRELERDFWAAMRAANLDVIVVDNGSEPPLPNGWRLDENAGFHRACNLGLELARTDAIVWLNNDIRMTSPDWVDGIRGGLEDGVLVGASLRYDRHGDVDGQTLPYLDGWCLAGMRADLLELGGFDESFDEPAYFGDNDLCLRARAAGMALREVRVGLEHLTNRTSDDDIAGRTAASRANRERFVARARDLIGVAA
jgi:GT2 family glycosyltransferase